LRGVTQCVVIAPMFSKTTLALGTALTAMALWSFIDSSLAQDAVAAPFTATDGEDIDNEDGDKDDNRGDVARRRLPAH